MPPTSFLIAGGTGRQGSAVVHALLTDPSTPIPPSQIYVLTRNLSGSTALKFAAQGINLIEGDLSNPLPIFSHLTTSGVSLPQTATFLAQAHGPTELPSAKSFLSTAITSKISHIVYSSVDRGGTTLSDRDASYCKTFSDKYAIEKFLIASTSNDCTITYTILRPVWFADNAIWGFAGKLCMTGWRDVLGGKKMQVVSTRDIGRWAVEALLRIEETETAYPGGLRNVAVSIASDALTFDEMNEIFMEETGKPVDVTWGWLARWVIWAVGDLRTMFGWIGEREYGAEMELLGRVMRPFGVREWVREGVQGKGQ